jgi:hypothetical protein
MVSSKSLSFCDLTFLDRKLLRPCIHEGFLAPTTEQRLKYANWLHVWGKERVLVSDRMSNLIDMFHVWRPPLCSFLLLICTRKH